jgi:peptide/nickel transport system permease protein
MKGAPRSGRKGSTGLWSAGWARFGRNRLGLAGAVIVIAFYLVAVFAPILTPHDPIEHGDIPRMRYLAPSMDHPLGTDKFGRDVLARVIYGSRISLSISFLAVSISVIVGSIVGAAAGHFGGLVDSILMRIVDSLMAIPRLFLLLTCVALFSRSLLLIVILLGATGWMATARLVRGQILSLRNQDFVRAAEALGAGSSRIVLRHLLPNTLTVIIIAATLRIGEIILAEAALSFLGLGVQPPTPSWGQMVFEGREVLLGAWWVSAFPGLVIAVTVIGYNLLGDGLRDAFEPRRYA